MINNSTLTLQDVKDHFVRTRDDQNISDSDVIDAANDFYNLVHQYERKRVPGKYRTKQVVSVDENGYDVTLLPNIADATVGFRVYDGTVDVRNMIMRRHPATRKNGYFFEGDTLFLKPTPTTSKSITLEYNLKGTRIAVGATLSDNVLQINQELERAFREYVRASFYDGEYQFDLKQQAEQVALAEIEQAFDNPLNLVNA